MARAGSAQEWQLETSISTATELFRGWQSAMQRTARQIGGNRWWLEEEGIGLKLNREIAHGVSGVDLATNRRCSPVTVQINMPRALDNVNKPTQIGRDPDHRVWLLRQGRLKPNRVSTNLIAGQQFQELTTIPCAFRTPGSGSHPARLWFRVCELGVEEGSVRAQTSAFVRLCQQAREIVANGAEAIPLGDANLAILLDALEPTGSYWIPPQAGTTAERRHGEVVHALQQRLNEQNIRNYGVRHDRGYQVDLVVEGNGSPPLLVEVKTDTTAQDVQTGVGQLVLYRQLIPRLQHHTPVLLMPAQPPPELEAAVRGCGIAWHVYAWAGPCAGQGQIRFDEAFMSLCGIGRPIS